MQELRKKRTIQSKIVEQMIISMFTKESIFSLIEILFKDMDEDHKIFDPEEEESSSQECSDGQSESCALRRMNVIDDRFSEHEAGVEEDDPSDYGKDIQEYLEVKGVLSIERIKDIVGEIVGSC